MTQTIFLSTVSNEFGALRRRLASLAQRTKKCLVRYQDEFFHRGVKTLQKLVEEVQQSDLIVHVIGAQSGWCIPADQAIAFLNQNLDFEKQFPVVALQGRNGNLPATQWEAWLGLFFDKRLISFHLQTSDVDNLQKTHIDRLNNIEEHPDIVADMDGLFVEILGSLITLGVFTQEDIRRPINLPFPTLGNLFKGREEFLEELRRRLTQSATGGVAITTRPQALFGAGGVGKTRTAIEYAWRNAENYSALLFLSAASPAALTTSLANLVGVLGIDGMESAADDTRLQAVLDWLRAHPGWLAILDNVDDDETAKAVKERLAGLAEGHVLITSRLSAWSGAVDKLELDLLPLEAATDYLLQAADQRTRCDDDAAQAETLARKIGLLSLGLEHAAAYMNAGGRSFTEYMQEWDRDEASILVEFDLNQIDYPRELLVTWRLSVDRLDPESRKLLEILSWLAPDPLAESTIEMLESQPVVGVRGSLNVLVKYSLVKRQAKDYARSYTQHQLVQATTRYCQRTTSAIESDTELPQLEAALAWMNRAYEGNTQDVREWPRLDPLVPHVRAVCEFADRQSKVTKDHATSHLLNEIGTLFIAKARHREAEPLIRRALAIDEQSYGAEHPNVSIRLNNLAQLLQDTNRLAEVEPLMRRALAIDEQAYGAEHPSVAIRLNNLALLLQASNRKAEAEPLMRRALIIDERAYGAEHPKFAIGLNNLAHLLRATNRLEEAEILMRRALAIDEQFYGTKHPPVAIRLNNLALLLKATNRLAEAEPLMRRALAIDEQSYGTEHPTVAIRLNNLAQLLHDMNRLAEAEPLSSRMITIFMSFGKATGHAHPHMKAALANYHALLTAMGLSEAEAIAKVQVKLRGAQQ
jgi:tetratricopeptide (TPR) repeat protein